MGLLSMLERRSLENPNTSLANPDAWLIHALGAQSTYSGVTVSPQTAMQLATVAACHRIIGEAVASLPLPVYERLEPRGKRRATEFPLYRILHDEVNSEGLTAFSFRETMLHHLCGWGNAFAEIQYNGAGAVAGLWPLLPDRTRVERKNNQKIVITRVREDGFEKEVALPRARVLHVPGMSFDGLTGYGYIRLQRQMLGAAMAAEEFAARFFGNGLHMGLVVRHPKALTDQAKDRIRTSLEYLQGGLSQAHRMAVLEEDMKLDRLGIPPEEAQFLETRKFDREQIAMMYRVPLHLLQVGGSDAGQSYASVEQKSLEFVLYTIRPWLVRIEQAMNSQLLSVAERSRYFAEHVVDGLLRGDYKTRMDGHAVRRQWGLASYNDIADIENWPFDETPVGDMRLIPLNMIPADMAREAVEPKEEAPPSSDDDDADEPEEEEEAAQAPPPSAVRFGVLLQRRGRSHLPILEQAMRRVVKLEVVALRRILKGAADVETFVAGAEKFYGAETWRHDFSQRMGPAINAVACTIGEDLREWAMSTAELWQDAERLAALLVERLGAEHAQESKEKLCAEMEGAPDPLAAIERLLTVWENFRADGAARSLSAELPDSIARSLATILGVRDAFTLQAEED